MNVSKTVLGAIAIISLYATLANPVEAHIYSSEDEGTASTNIEWGIPLALVGEYTSHVLKLGVKGLSVASATSRGSMCVYGVAWTSGWATATLKWYMKGVLLAPFINYGAITNDAWVTVKFEAIDLTAGSSVEKVLLHEHANPLSGTDFDGEYTGTMQIPLSEGHLYKFVFNVETHAEVLGVVAVTVADFGSVFWSDSRIEWRYIDVPGTEPAPRLDISVVVEEWYGYSGGTTEPPPGTYYHAMGETVTVTACPYGGWEFTSFALDGLKSYVNPISFTVNSQEHTLIADFHKPGGGGGGQCPTLFVWNGTDYAEEGILDIHAASDVTVEHEIQNTLTPKNHVFKLQLREMDNYTSHMDQVKLLAVDASGETIECRLIGAKHSEDGNVLYELLMSDDVRTDTEPDEYIDLTFLSPKGDINHFTFVIEGYNHKMFDITP